MQRTALLSVYNKDGIIEFAQGLIRNGFEIFSSGGTAKVLIDAGIPVTDIATIVGPPILGHKVVTLSRELFAGILASEHERAELETLGIRWIDLVRVDMYPLVEEINKADATVASVTEKTDIGGSTMLRAAAKSRRLVVATAEDGGRVLEALAAGTEDDPMFRLELAANAEDIVANYVNASARYLGRKHFEAVS